MKYNVGDNLIRVNGESFYAFKVETVSITKDGVHYSNGNTWCEDNDLAKTVTEARDLAKSVIRLRFSETMRRLNGVIKDPRTGG